jgi:serine/threonine-protein kinase RsbW
VNTAIHCSELCYERKIGSTKELDPVLEAVVDLMVRHGYPPADVWAVRLILEEAVCNAVKHGSRGQPGKQVHIRCCISPERVLGEVEDEGCGFDPEQVLDPRRSENLDRPDGRGLLLMRHYATWLRIREPGNCVCFGKVCSLLPSSPLRRKAGVW